MKTIFNRTLATLIPTLILAGVSATAIANPAAHARQAHDSNYGFVETSQLYLLMEDTYLAENDHGLLQPTPSFQYEEDVPDPLVMLPGLTGPAGGSAVGAASGLADASTAELAKRGS